MPLHTFSASAEIPAPAEKIYALIADYRVGHPSILPKPPFVALHVEKGGIGAGTVIRVKMRIMGVPGTFRAEVTEPEPGRVLAETDLSNGRETRFVVEPLPGDRCRVTIETLSAVLGGPLGRLQGSLLERLLHPIYMKELGQLATLAGTQTA